MRLLTFRKRLIKRRMWIMARHTRGAIIDSFWTLLNEKSLDKITVKDVIELAEINRNTFYYHFEDLYALLDTVFREEAERYRSNIDENGTFYEEYIRAASVFMDNRNAIIHVYNSKGKEVLNKYMKDASDDLVSRFVRQKAKGTDLPDEGSSYITRFYSYAIVGITMEWVENGMPEYRKNLLKTVSETFESTIDMMIKNYIVHNIK